MKNTSATTAYLFAALLAASCNTRQPDDTNLPLQGKVKIETIAVSPKIGGRISKILVTEGQMVYKGDTLAIISIPELDAKLEQANGALLSAEGQLDLAVNGATAEQLQQIQSQLDAAAAQLDFAEKSFRRIQNMFNDSLVPAQQYDEVKSKYTAAAAQVNVIREKQKEILNGTRPETIRSARGQMTRAAGAKKEVITAAGERILTAPADMQIESITLQEGELALPGYTLISGNDISKVSFRFTVSEKEINKYKIGDPVKIRVAGTDKIIAASVSSVIQMARYADNTSTAPNRQIGESFFELKTTPGNQAEAYGIYNNTTVFLEK